MVFENVAQWFGAELTLLNTILFMIAFITLKAITNLLAMYIVSSSAAEITAGFRKRLVAAIMNARWSYFTQKSAGYISTALNNEPQFAANCIVKQCSFIADIFQVLVYFTIALFMSWQVTSVAVGIGALCTLLLLFAFKKSRRAGQDQTNNQKALMAKILDIFRMMKPMKAMGREKHALPFIYQKIENLRSSYTWIVFGPNLIEQTNEVVKVTSLGLGLFALVHYQLLEIENLIILAVIFLRVLQRVTALQKSYAIIASQVASFTYTLDTIEQAESFQEEFKGTRSASFNTGIHFKGVSYRYEHKNILQNAEFKINAGGIHLITGPSGVGKSTLVNLICGLHTPNEGAIVIDETPLEELEIRSWRQKIGYIPQEPFLLNDNVRNNITLYDQSFKDEEVWDALTKAGAKDFVEKLEAAVGESGGQLSGGQRQRLTIARALIQKPDILILDEATSGLEKKTEAEIFKTLTTLKKDMTILAITHDMDLKKYADKIYALENQQLKSIK